MMPTERPAHAAIYLATAPEPENVTSKYFTKDKEEKSSKESYDPAVAERLWQVSGELTKLDPNGK